ncbi:hypothetical protein JCM10908_002253 [Rhodotorula pacifica]|uniref:trifunctional dihydropteroate synthetase/dihydrohydroxymethylpterin pyrophosphokinase/dihydroneopterin aldolase FOL1 n=1 Tax=Rhodotorula pacifica TaxID=1495444 RepID=UPI00317C61A6
MSDVIAVTDLQLRTPHLEPDLWQRPHKEQPLVCSLQVETSIESEADVDNLLADSLNYGAITKAIERHVERGLTLVADQEEQEEGEEEGLPLEVIAERLARIVLFECHAPRVNLQLERPRALLTAAAVGVSIHRTRDDYFPPTDPQDATSARLRKEATNPNDDSLYIRGLRRLIIIGLNPGERIDEQEVLVDLEFKHANVGPSSAAVNKSDPSMLPSTIANKARPGWRGWRGAVKRVEQHLSASRPLTIEHLVVSLASIILTPHSVSQSPSTSSKAGWDVPRTTVRVSKPSALMFAKYPSVSVTRTRAHFPSLRNLGTAAATAPAQMSAFSPAAATAGSSRGIASSAAASSPNNPDSSPGLKEESTPTLRTAFIGLGTNLGSRPGNLNNAVTQLDLALAGPGRGRGRIVETSWMYESEAMYHEEQDKFLNAAVKIETTLAPLDLLALLKKIETDLGRDFSTFRNGPRVIDLDLLLYDGLTYDSREGEGDKIWLKVPHQSIPEREFVLRPLVDIAPDFVHPVLGKSTASLLADLASSSTFRSTVHRVFPLSPSRVHPYLRASSHLPAGKSSSDPSRQTLVMSILNVTPDSFSDGDAERATDVEVARAEVSEHIMRGANIIDVGGMSTRPGADDIAASEEESRVGPVIRDISQEWPEKPVIISIDTFRPTVARAAVAAGAHIINDVYGGREPGMLETMAELACPVVLMHSRGTPNTMTSLTDYSADGGIVAGVRREMTEMVEKALAAGVRRWNIILDPGFGFAKTGQQNYVLLRSLDELFSTSDVLKEYPVLIGLSRKKFLAPGKAVAKERRLETAVGVACAIQSGWCEIARVHDTQDAVDVVGFADRLLNSKE